MRRVFGVLAALALLAGVGVALLWPGDEPDGSDGVVTISGLIGSEKREFFADPDVVAELQKQGLKVTTDTTGSWLMGESDLAKYDFAFPASLSPAEEIRKQRQIKSEPVRPFYSPLVVLAHRSMADVLKENGLAGQSSSEPAVWTLKMDAYLKAVQEGRKWQDLKGAGSHNELRGLLFLTTTDPSTSSSGALYLAAISYLANGHQVVSDDAGVGAVKDVVRQVTSVQGDQKTSSDGPFKDFLSGVGNGPVLAYESQMAALTAKGVSTPGGSAGDLVVLYPDTTVFSDHTLVALKPGAEKLAAVLRDDQVLRDLEAKYGFRPQADPGALGKAVKGRQGPAYASDLAAAGVQQAQVPTVAVLNKLINAAKGK
ncbi:substrate-binding domain-containing protein [Streptomyces sp. CB01881]|uniref:substrate-binding domain-containing protein n=1 Tax=Streptomyces sp. CB01881 TaxID=2078691 RepID=UPI0013873B78|nr:substrate-binding domain-containing protein [Streptomyces sp. CB01881]